MNERIRELAVQAGMVRGGYANTPDKIMTWRESFDTPGSLEKFAELIVQECIDCAEWVGRMNTTAVEPVNTAHAIVKRIEKHFGVK